MAEVGKRGRDDDQVGPLPPGADDDGPVGPALPKPKKKKVRKVVPSRQPDPSAAGAGRINVESTAHEQTASSLTRRAVVIIGSDCYAQVLPHEQVYLDSLPRSEMYEKSYMHRDYVTLTVRVVGLYRTSASIARLDYPNLPYAGSLVQAVTPGTDFFITASVDGHLKFWKKKFEV